MTDRPDFSPAMLKAFLRMRVRHAVATAFADTRNAERVEKTRIRKTAGVTNNEFDFAWNGRLIRAAPREKLWAALGIMPGAIGIVLTDDGGQERTGQ